MSKLTEYGWSSKLPYIIISELNQRKGPTRWCDRLGQYGVKVSFWLLGLWDHVWEWYPLKIRDL